MADEKILIEIEVDNDAAIAQLNQQNKEINILEKSQKELAKQGQKNSAQYQKQAQELKVLRQQRSQNIKFIKAEQGSLEQLRARLAQLTSERNKLTDVNGKNSESFHRLNEEILDLNESISKAEQAGGDFRRNVGNYPEAFGEAEDAVVGLGGSLGDLASSFTGGPLTAGIAAVTVAISGMVDAFQQTKFGKESAEIFEAAWSGALKTVGELMQGNISLWDAMNGRMLENQRIAIQQVQSRKAINKVQSDGAVILAKLTSEEEKYNDLANDSTLTLQEQEDNRVKLLEVQEKIYQQQKRQANLEVQFARASAEKAKGTADEIQAYELLNQALIAQQQVENDYASKQRQNLALQRQIESDLWEQRLDAAIDIGERIRTEYEKDANNADLTQKEREQALKKYNVAYSKYLEDLRSLAAEQGLTSEELDRLLGLKTPEELAAGLSGLKQGSEVVKTRFIEILKEFKISETERRDVIQGSTKITQDELDKRKQAEIKAANETYNILFSNYLKEEKLRISSIENDAKRKEAEIQFSEDRATKEAIRANQTIENENVKNATLEQIEIEHKERLASIDDKYTNLAIRNNDKLARERDKKRKEEERNEALKVKYQESLMSSVFSAAKSFASKNEKLQKAIGITEAVINTAKGITKAFGELPYPVAIPAAASIAITGAAQIATISSAGTSAQAPDIPNVDTGSNNNNVNTSQADQQIAQEQALAGALANIGISVAVSEINDTQNQVQVAEQQATI